MVKKESTSKEILKHLQVSKDLERLNSILIENFVSMQKALTNLAVKFDDLSIQISRLLQLFEISAKSFAEKISNQVPEIEKDKEFLNKLNTLVDQNKTIAKGLTLMEEKIRERLYGNTEKRVPIIPQRMIPGNYISQTQEEERPKPRPLPQY